MSISISLQILNELVHGCQQSACLNRITYANVDACDGSVLRSNNGDFHLHCFQNDYGIAALNSLANLTLNLEYLTSCTSLDLYAACCASCLSSCQSATVSRYWL